MKAKFFSIILILFFFSFTEMQAQVQTGSFFFDNSTPDFTLSKGSGKRSVEKEIYFDKPFNAKPHIFLSLTVIDAAEKTRLRYGVDAMSVSRDGFVVKISVWGDTKINGIGGNWIAVYKELNLETEPIEVGKTIQLNNVFFEFNKAGILPESKPELDKVVSFLKNHSTVEIELSGHTDNIGSDAYNLQLSQKRAESVKAYLTASGIKVSRLKAKGYGESRPIATNDTEYGREQNRRVEFTILKK
ncbi:MAG: hypothetical protein A2V66_08295 [Ignavibacteria bacterium RBG_13_36_8]|nr:MAG: hypothetical protein A2V66_08295 [Ignavibacteria bacterium RBG_13_36_8]